MVHVGVARDKDKVKLLNSPSPQVILTDGEVGVMGMHGRQYSTGGIIVKEVLLNITWRNFI